MVMHNLKVSLIVSTYNWPQALDLCLRSLLRQTRLPVEIIIADDGSTGATAQLIESYREQFNIPIVHVWQQDEGFQLARIRNKAIARSSGDYIIQIDGDLILEKNFIEDHINFSKQGSFVSGTRVQLSAGLSARLLQHASINVSVFSKGIKNISNGLRSAPLRSFFAERYKANNISYVRGCNMAFWKAQLISVNGYNEAIKGWGREDSELAIRLVNWGIKKRIIKFGAVAFHIYHPEAPRQNLALNDKILEIAIKENIKTCGLGLSQYLHLP